MTENAPASPGSLKRFYRTASAAPVDGGFAILLDGRPARTPGRAILAAPQKALADAIAAEWDNAGDTIDLDAMTLTRLASTVIDHGARDRDQWADEIAKYAGTDLLCYRASTPAELCRRQRAALDPLLEWIAGEIGVRLAVTEGVVAIAQPQTALDAVRARAAALSDHALLAAMRATQLAGSAVIGLALAARAFPAKKLFAASRLDEAFQAEQWGVDSEAHAREKALEAEFMKLDAWFEAISG